MAMASSVRVAGVDLADDAVQLEVEAGDTQPFTARKTMHELELYAAGMRRTLGEAAVAPFPAGQASKRVPGMEAVLQRLLQAWFDDASQTSWPTARPRPSRSARALGANLARRQVASVQTSATARAGGMAWDASRLGANMLRTKIGNLWGGAGADGPKEVVWSEANIDILVSALGRMRGGATKFAQKVCALQRTLPGVDPRLFRALEQRVLNHTSVLPAEELERAMAVQLGTRDWRTAHFQTFQDEPIASASLGQVHAALLPDGSRVVAKLLFPGVAETIEADVELVWKLVFRGATTKAKDRNSLQNRNVLDQYIRLWREECDYAQEARHQARYTALFAALPEAARADYDVPELIPTLCRDGLLVQRFVSGLTLDLCASQVDQALRDRVATLLLRLKLTELFRWGFLNADPHAGNFLYNSRTGRLGVIDFGCCRELTPEQVQSVRRCFEALMTDDRAAFDAWLLAEGVVRTTDPDEMRTRLWEANRFYYAAFRTAEGGGAPGAFDFGAWYDDAQQRGLQDNKDYLDATWAGQAVEEGEAAMSFAATLLTEYLLILVMHCGRLRAKVDAARLYAEVAGEGAAPASAAPA